MTRNTQANGHAFLSPSSAKTWTTCYPSIVLGRQIPDSKASDDAKKGTKAHSFAEKSLKLAIKGAPWTKELHESCDDSEMTGYVEDYVNFCLSVKSNFAKAYNITVCEVEKTIERSANNFGTADFLLIGSKFNDVSRKTEYAAVIVDFKYGRGVDVAVEGNMQIANYAVCIEPTYRIKLDKVFGYIYQPRIGDAPYERWAIHGALLKEYKQYFNTAEKEILAACEKFDKEKDSSKLVFNAGDLTHCRWCKVKPQCPAFRDSIKKDALVILDSDGTEKEEAYPDLSLIPIEKVVAAYKRRKAVESFFEDMGQFLLSKMERGTEVDGLKLVAGRRQRRWIKGKEEAIAKTLIERGIAEPWTKQLINLTDAEKMLGKNGAEKISDLVNLTEPKLQIADADDPRPAVDTVGELSEMLIGE